ncbi:MAG: iron ABC transporter permease [Alphaproteobacteria bacterium]
MRRPADRPAAGLQRRAARNASALAIGAAALLLSLLADIGTGPGWLSPGEILAALFAPSDQDLRTAVIVWDIRLPVAAMAVLVGAMLGVAGAQMQTILGNPLADPFTLGISSAASVGAAVAIVFGLGVAPVAGPLIVTTNAFVFAFVTALAIYALTRYRGVSPSTMILFGIALMFTFNAILGLLQYRASETQLAQIVFWMMGSLTRASWIKIAIGATLFAVLVPLMWRHRFALTALRMGDDRAASFGVDVDRLRLQVLIQVALLASTAVSFVGVIGFVGLVGPHIARLLVGEDQRWFVPLSALCGALILSLTSIAAKNIVPGVIYPVGIITALVGVPFFISLILNRRSYIA